MSPDLQPTPVVPDPTPAARGFWDALAEGRVDIQRCDVCDRWVWYPRARCPACLSPDLTWTTVTGNGTLYSFTVARQPTTEAFAEAEDLILAVVELDEGPKVTSVLEEVAPAEVHIGMTVEPLIVATGADSLPLLRHRPRSGDGTVDDRGPDASADR